MFFLPDLRYTFRQRYKKLVDKVFPSRPRSGLVQSKMDKLKYYSITSPEKMDRISKRLKRKVSGYIFWSQYGFVSIAIEVMDQLLAACNSHSLNLFAGNFFRTLQKILETNNPALQILASESFVKFSHIREETPSYHRRYEIFIIAFASLCQSNHADADTRNRLRIAGLNGIRAVIRKTIHDILMGDIWATEHTNRIVPSILYNMMQTKSTVSPDNTSEVQLNCATLAETCFRELIVCASFQNIHSVMASVLQHLDVHGLWVPNDFATYILCFIMYSMPRYSYQVVTILLDHMDKSLRCGTEIRTGMVDVLSKVVSIAAVEGVCISVLDISNSLIKHLKESINFEIMVGDAEAMTREKLYQESLVLVLVQFTSTLPHFQQKDMVVFINGIALSNSDTETAKASANTLQLLLLKCLFKISCNLTFNLQHSLSMTLLDSLLQMALSEEREVRLLVQQIFQLLISRRDKHLELKTPTAGLRVIDSVPEQRSRSDVLLFENNGKRFLSILSQSLQVADSDLEIMQAVFSTATIICTEFVCGETLAPLLSWALKVQDIASTGDRLTTELCNSLRVELIEILAYVIENTEKYVPTIIPMPAFEGDRLHSSTEPFVCHPPPCTDLKLDTDLPLSLVSKPKQDEKVTFKTLKDTLCESEELSRRTKLEKGQVLCDKFKSTPFHQLVESPMSNDNLFHDSLERMVHVECTLSDPIAFSQQFPNFYGN